MKTGKTWFATGSSKGLEFEIAKAALQADNRVAVRVNNAGYGLRSGIEEATDAEVWRQYDLFRTNFPDEKSFVASAGLIDDYKDTVGQICTRAAESDGAQSGDPQKLAQALLTLAAQYRRKTTALEAEIADQQSVTEKTDFETGPDTAR